jgi:hypothetical protein
MGRCLTDWWNTLFHQSVRHLPMDRCFTSQSDTYPWTGVSPVSQSPTHGQVFHQSVRHLPMDRCFTSQSDTYPWTGVSPVIICHFKKTWACLTHFQQTSQIYLDYQISWDKKDRTDIMNGLVKHLSMGRCLTDWWNICSWDQSVRHLPMDRCFTSQSDTYPWTGVSPVSQTPTHGQVFHQRSGITWKVTVPPVYTIIIIVLLKCKQSRT